MCRPTRNWVSDEPGARFLVRARRAIFALALLVGLAASAAPSPTEYQVKAAFIYNFTQFVEWPSSAYATTNAPLVIGIVGDDPFDKTLDDLIRGEVVRGHPLVLKRLSAAEDLRSCHLLFISRSEQERWPAIFDQLKGRPVLLVGDSDGFAQQGGVVNFFIENKAVKMEINKLAADQAGLHISSKLFNLARVLKSK